MDKENKGIELVNSYECYGFNKPSQNKDTCPKWMEQILVEQKPKVKPITDVSGIWP